MECFFLSWKKFSKNWEIAGKNTQRKLWKMQNFAKNTKKTQKHKKSKRDVCPPLIQGAGDYLKAWWNQPTWGKNACRNPPPRGGRSKGWVQPAAAFEWKKVWRSGEARLDQEFQHKSYGKGGKWPKHVLSDLGLPRFRLNSPGGKSRWLDSLGAGSPELKKKNSWNRTGVDQGNEDKDKEFFLKKNVQNVDEALLIVAYYCSLLSLGHFVWQPTASKELTSLYSSGCSRSVSWKRKSLSNMHTAMMGSCVKRTFQTELK